MTVCYNVGVAFFLLSVVAYLKKKLTWAYGPLQWEIFTCACMQSAKNHIHVIAVLKKQEW